MYNHFMKKPTDFRKISLEELQKIKDKAMKLRDKGISNKEVAEKLNINPSVLSRWYRKYSKNFSQPQDVLIKGREEGTHTKLTINQEKIIIEILQEYKGLLDKELVQKIVDAKNGWTWPPITEILGQIKRFYLDTNNGKYLDPFLDKPLHQLYLS